MWLSPRLCYQAPQAKPDAGELREAGLCGVEEVDLVVLCPADDFVAQGYTTLLYSFGRA